MEFLGRSQKRRWFFICQRLYIFEISTCFGSRGIFLGFKCTVPKFTIWLKRLLITASTDTRFRAGTPGPAQTPRPRRPAGEHATKGVFPRKKNRVEIWQSPKPAEPRSKHFARGEDRKSSLYTPLAWCKKRRTPGALPTSIIWSGMYIFVFNETLSSLTPE